jgi:hypothetical protein
MEYVYLQVGSSNSTGAAAGYLFKLEKIKSMDPPEDVMHWVLTKMPATEEAYELLMSQHRTTHGNMKGSLSDKVDIKYCVVSSMGHDVFAVYDADEGFVICNVVINNKEGFTDEIVVHKKLVLV